MLASQFLTAEYGDVVEFRDALAVDFTGSKVDVFGVSVGTVTQTSEVLPAVVFGWARPIMGRAYLADGVLTGEGEGGEHFKTNFEGFLSHTDFTRRFRDITRILFFAVPRPLAYAQPGDAAHCQSLAGPGTFGPHVARGEIHGLLTAGHVTRNVGDDAFDAAGNYVGKVGVRMCCEFDRSGNAVASGTDVADVAMIDEHDPDDHAPGGTQGEARPWANVTAVGAVTTGKRSALATVGAPFAGPDPNYGNWAEAMMTQYPISVGGDSGAAVYNDAGELVGQVVGGYPGVYSVVQDIDYLLGEIGAVLR